jgi:hypothetical protein
VADFAQHPVAVALAEGVVDLLEAVEVEVEQGEVAAGADLAFDAGGQGGGGRR